MTSFDKDPINNKERELSHDKDNIIRSKSRGEGSKFMRTPTGLFLSVMVILFSATPTVAQDALWKELTSESFPRFTGQA
jgi:hypothetical protein